MSSVDFFELAIMALIRNCLKSKNTTICVDKCSSVYHIRQERLTDTMVEVQKTLSRRQFCGTVSNSVKAEDCLSLECKSECGSLVKSLDVGYQQCDSYLCDQIFIY